MLAEDHDGEHVAVKFIERGKVDRNVEREVLMHSTLRHPNVIGFKRVFLTDQHLGIILEFATGGELFERVKSAGRFDEHMARFFFQQLIAGVQFIHEQGLAHRDLKLENTLIKLEETRPGKRPTPVLKIADFGFCKHEDLHSAPDSRVGTPAYISPEVLQAPQRYDGKAADVWSCAVHLYIMLVGWYPFTDPREPKNFPKTASNILKGRFAFPRNLTVSPECQELIKAMLQRDPQQRITIPQIKDSVWFQTNLSRELADNCRGLPCYQQCQQSPEEIQAILKMAAHK